MMMEKKSLSEEEWNLKIDLDVIDFGGFFECLSHVSSVLQDQWDVSITMAGGAAPKKEIDAFASIKVGFQQGDLIHPSGGVLETVARADVITLFFTLNELFEQNLKVKNVPSSYHRRTIIVPSSYHHRTIIVPSSYHYPVLAICLFTL